MKVEQFYNINQFLIRDKGTLYLQSYDSIVAKIDKNGVLSFGVDWDYSHTTLKHLYLFLNYHKYLITINNSQRDNIAKLNDQPNKKAFLQKLIDNKIIKVDNKL